MTRIFSIIALIFTLSAAQVAAQSPGMFDATAPIKVNATSMSIEFENVPPREYPHVGHRAPLSYEQAVRAWADKRIMLTGGGENTVRIRVREADIVEKLLPVKKGIAGWFRKDQATEYAARLDLAVMIVDPNGQVMGSAEAKSWHSTTMGEGATEADKQATWNDMIHRTFANLDNELEPRMRQYLTNYVE